MKGSDNSSPNTHDMSAQRSSADSGDKAASMSVTHTRAESGDYSTTVDEQFRSLLEGLRTTLPGAQVMVAFLLVLPFQQPFETLSVVERFAYFLAFAFSILASALLIAPSVHQRMRSPFSGVTRKTEEHLASAVRVSIAGTIALLLALVAVVYLVTSVIYTTVAATVGAVVLAAVAGYSWIYQPVIRFREEED